MRTIKEYSPVLAQESRERKCSNPLPGYHPLAQGGLQSTESMSVTRRSWRFFSYNKEALRPETNSYDCNPPPLPNGFSKLQILVTGRLLEISFRDPTGTSDISRTQVNPSSSSPTFSGPLNHHFLDTCLVPGTVLYILHTTFI